MERILIEGVVEHGRRLGRELGFPTANLAVPEDVAAADGVYRSRAEVGGKVYDAMSNLGRNPSVGGVELIVPRPGMTDSVYNYLANQHDSIDFSHGPVTLRITSQDRMLTRDYRVSVNVHLTQPDSLSWNLTQQSPLPTTLTAPTVARAVEFGGKTVVVSADAAGNACVATADNPSDRWTTASATLPAGADVMSLAAGADALYMTTASGELYTAGPWTPTGA